MFELGGNDMVQVNPLIMSYGFFGEPTVEVILHNMQ